MMKRRHLILALACSILAAVPTLGDEGTGWMGLPRDRIPSVIKVTLDSTPAGATVSLVELSQERIELGTAAPPLTVDLQPGRYRFLFELAGHRPRLRVVDVVGQARMSVKQELLAQPPSTAHATAPLRLKVLSIMGTTSRRTAILEYRDRCSIVAPGWRSYDGRFSVRLVHRDRVEVVDLQTQKPKTYYF